LLIRISWNGGHQSNCKISNNFSNVSYSDALIFGKQIEIEELKNVAKKLNLRPRKKLGFSNPKSEFFKQIANFALASCTCKQIEIV